MRNFTPIKGRNCNFRFGANTCRLLLAVFILGDFVRWSLLAFCVLIKFLYMIEDFDIQIVQILFRFLNFGLGFAGSESDFWHIENCLR